MARKNEHHLYKRGNTWYFRKEGIRFSLETTVKTEAIRLRDQLLENHRLYGKFTFDGQAEEVVTFGQLAKEWAAIHQKKVKYSSWRDYRSAMNKHVLPAFKDMAITDISYRDIEHFVARLSCKNKRANNILVPMRCVFKWAFKCGYITENVMDKVDNLKPEQPDIHPLSFEEAVQVIEAVDYFYRPYTLVRFFTGMRAGEIDALYWSDYKPNKAPDPQIHINKAFVYGREGETKTKKSKRYIDCMPWVVDAIGDQWKLTGDKRYIFLTKDGNRMSPDHFRDVVWRPALEKAGLTYRPPIQTRHSFATMMLSGGEDIGWVQNMLGHASLQMIQTRYYSWIPKKTRNDGSAFLASVGEDKNRLEKKVSERSVQNTDFRGAEVIAFPKVTQK